jgi:murein DD-endopeptidase MepM/ murein hydrolase activator NlpD
MYDPLHNPDDPTGPRKSRFWALRHAARAPERWQWPLVRIDGRDPIVLADHINGSRRGVDLGYESRPYDAALFVPVFAVQSGEVMFCAETTSGFAVSLRHSGTDWATSYGHLSKVFVADTESKRRRASDWVRAGDVIGYAAKSPIHIRFELVKWTADRRFVAVDPKPELATWTKPTVEGPASFAAKKAA